MPYLTHGACLRPAVQRKVECANLCGEMFDESCSNRATVMAFVRKTVDRCRGLELFPKFVSPVTVASVLGVMLSEVQRSEASRHGAWRKCSRRISLKGHGDAERDEFQLHAATPTGSGPVVIRMTIPKPRLPGSSEG